MKILGIDLSGKEQNPTGFCILQDNNIKLQTIYTNKDIIRKIRSIEPEIIITDAPLSLPRGRCCLEKDCECRRFGHFRESEKEIRRYGSVLPLTFRGMKELTLRGIYLRNILSDFKWEETHSGTVKKILGWDHFNFLKNYFQVDFAVTKHELDAALAAVCGLFYLHNCYFELGDRNEGTIILPCDKSLEEIICRL